LIALIIVLGLVWGSFLTAFSYRLDDINSLILSRSKCPKCGHLLGGLDLMPVLSYLVLAGHCRYCRKPIGIEYPATELVSAMIALGVYLTLGLNAPSIILFLSLSLLIVAALNDFESQEVALPVFVCGIILALIFRLWGNLNIAGVENLLLSVLVCAALPLCFAVLSREKWMGFGDIFFAVWMGIIISFPQSLLAIFIAFFAGALFGIIYLMAHGRKKENKIPFGPFLALGTVTGLFFGGNLLEIYLKVLGL